MLSKDDLAYSIVEDYLAGSPEFIDVVEASSDNGYSEEKDYNEVYDLVLETLEEVRQRFTGS